MEEPLVPSLSENSDPAPSGLLGVTRQTYAQALQEADLALYLEDFRDALRLFSKAMALEPDRGEPWIGQILAQLFLGQFTEAYSWSRQAMAQIPDDPAMPALHGLVLCLQGKRGEGLERLDKAVKQNPCAVMCLIARGWAFLEMRKNWQREFARADKLCPSKDWRFRMLMALLLERKKMWREAAAYFEKIVMFHPQRERIWERVEECYRKGGSLRKAYEVRTHARSGDSRVGKGMERGSQGVSLFKRLAVLLRRGKR